MKCVFGMRWKLTLIILMLFGLTNFVQAVPSFARQTGMACNACHTAFPELTQFGRVFKLNGYTLTGLKQIQSGDGGKPDVKINETPPFSAMLVVGYTSQQTTPADQQKNSLQFPQQLSFFYAGEISPKIGSFIQVTYDQETDKVNWDNADIRFADHTQVSGKDMIYGVTLNNSPGVQDPWHTQRVWGFPYLSSGPDPTHSPMLDGMLAQQVAGLGLYGMWDSQYYAELTLYRSASPGHAVPDATSTDTVKNVAPYWRLAYEKNVDGNNWMLGLYGMTADIYPTGVSGPTDRYADIGIDTQYMGKLGDAPVSVHASYTTEKRSLDASAAGASVNLKSFRIDGTYYNSYQSPLTIAYFTTSGDESTSWGTPANKPDSAGWVLEAAYLPWLNTKFAVQYKMYDKFDGTSDNASDNNTLYLSGWFMW